MTGIFDSGVGGFASFRVLRKLMPREDILYLADREGAPYGTKEKDVLLPLIKRDISRLRERGAERILIACCTASSLWSELSPEEREISFPIISPAARAAAECGKKITVIATDYTVKARAFSREIKKFRPEAAVTELSAQALVSLVEGGARDGALLGAERDTVEEICRAIKETEPEALILGCTHFSHLDGEIKKRLGGVKMIAPAIIGATEFAKNLKKEKRRAERGVTLYL